MKWNGKELCQQYWYVHFSNKKLTWNNKIYCSTLKLARQIAKQYKSTGLKVKIVEHKQIIVKKVVN